VFFELEKHFRDLAPGITIAKRRLDAYIKYFVEIYRGLAKKCQGKQGF
jgi:hypothetical protein